ncbi:YetF domain-containing protein [Paenibacillus sp. S-38]|uniref:YetF domain-containing protein n=1 Tax=Paenibacillus sp. S-38 TaxID=3416710 RepID=UPI003CF5B103
MDYLYIFIKLGTGFIGLWLITKLLGKKEISQLTPFDFVSSLMLSELVGASIYDREVHFPELVFALVLWGVLSLGFEKVLDFFPWLNPKLSGRPDVLIRDGRVDPEALERNKLDWHQVTMLLREQSIFSLREVAFAVFEPNGNLSVLKKSSSASVERQDLELPDKPVELPVLLIDKGYVNEEQLQGIGRDKHWLEQKLREQGIARLEDVYYGEWTESGGMYVQAKP